MHRKGKITGIVGLALLLALGTLAVAQAQDGLDDETKTALAAALDDEREARALYGAAIGKYEGRGPFARIVRAEEHHEAHLLDLYAAHGLEPPADPWIGHAFELPQTAAEACAQAVQWEEENAAMFDRFLAREDLPQDVRAVFERLGTVSRERHLPAFQRCAAGETAGQGGRMGGGMQGGQGRQGGMHGGGGRHGGPRRPGGAMGCGCCGGGGGMAGHGGQGMGGGPGMGGQDDMDGQDMGDGQGMQGRRGMGSGGMQGGCARRAGQAGKAGEAGMGCGCARRAGDRGGKGMDGGKGKPGGCCRQGADAMAPDGGAPDGGDEGDAEDSDDASAAGADTASGGPPAGCDRTARVSAGSAAGSSMDDSGGPQDEVGVAGVMVGSACRL